MFKESTKEELLKGAVIDILRDELKTVRIDVNDIADTVSIKMIEEIQKVLIANGDDFEIVEEIVRIFEKYNINAGPCHDF